MNPVLPVLARASCTKAVLGLELSAVGFSPLTPSPTCPEGPHSLSSLGDTPFSVVLPCCRIVGSPRPPGPCTYCTSHARREGLPGVGGLVAPGYVGPWGTRPHPLLGPLFFKLFSRRVTGALTGCLAFRVTKDTGLVGQGWVVGARARLTLRGRGGPSSPWSSPCCFCPWQGDPGVQGTSGPPGEDGERVRLQVGWVQPVGNVEWTAKKTSPLKKIFPP